MYYLVENREITVISSTLVSRWNDSVINEDQVGFVSDKKSSRFYQNVNAA